MLALMHKTHLGRHALTKPNHRRLDAITCALHIQVTQASSLDEALQPPPIIVQGPGAPNPPAQRPLLVSVSSPPCDSLEMSPAPMSICDPSVKTAFSVETIHHY